MLNIRTLCTEGGNTIIWGEKWGREEKKNEDGGEKWKVHCLDTLIIQQYGSLRAKKRRKLVPGSYMISLQPPSYQTILALKKEKLKKIT